jgi:hypothetical protein
VDSIVQGFEDAFGEHPEIDIFIKAAENYN